MPAAVSLRPPSILVVCGATGVGKTEHAIELCERLGGEIVGADSVQIYRGFDIGSAKPTAAQLRGIPHHLIDVLDPQQEIDAARFAALADAAIATVRQRGRVPIVVGGTGLWLRALLRGLVPLPAVDVQLRAALELEFQTHGGVPMHARLQEVDPQTAARVHPRDMLRIVRALEVHAQTGHAIGALHREHALGAPRYRARTLALDVPRPQWLTTIAERGRAMLDAGLIDEVQGLIERHGSELKPMRSVGYRQVVEGIERGLAQSEVEAAIVQATRQYGKRQRTWFQSDPCVDRRIDANELFQAGELEAIRRHVGDA